MLKETSQHYTFSKKMLILIFVPAGMRLRSDLNELLPIPAAQAIR
jgi:hypothetical protein